MLTMERKTDTDNTPKSGVKRMSIDIAFDFRTEDVPTSVEFG